MAKKVFLVLVVVLSGCGFVFHDEKAERVNYERLVSAIGTEVIGIVAPPPLNQISGPSNEFSPQIYYNRRGEAFLFFTSARAGSNILYVSRRNPDGTFGESRLFTNAQVLEYSVWNDSVGGQNVNLLYTMGGGGTGMGQIHLLDSELRVTNSVSLVETILWARPVPVWDAVARTWETWLLNVQITGTTNRLVRSIITSIDPFAMMDIALAIWPSTNFYADTHGFGVRTGSLMNFHILAVKDGDGLGPSTAFTFNYVGIRIQAGAVSVTNYPVYTTLTNVMGPFVDVFDGYKVYFSMRRDNDGDGRVDPPDLYRFRYLTWDKMIPWQDRQMLP